MPIWLTLTPLTLFFWAAYATMVVPELLGTLVQRERQAGHKRDGGTERVLVAAIIAAQILAFNLAPRLPWARMGGDQVPYLAAGSIIILAGIFVRWYAIRVLGRFFTRNVAIREDHEIVRAGPYRYVRHPSYSGYLLAAVGLGIALDSWVALAILLLLNGAAFGYRMKVEEAALRTAFGPRYAAYQAETKRVIPFVY